MPESSPLITLLCHTAPESVAQIIRSSLENLHLPQETNSIDTLTIQTLIKKPPLALRFSISPHPNLPRTTLLTITYSPGAWIKFLGIGLNVLADIHVFLIVLYLAFSLFFHSDHTLFLDTPLTPLVIFSTAWIPLGMFWRQRYFVRTEGVTQVIEVIIANLTKECQVEPLSPLTIRLSSGKGLNIFPILFEAAKVLLAVFLFGLFWGMALAFLFYIKGMFQSFLNRFRHQWRGVFLSYYDIYASICGDVLFIILLSVVFTATIFNFSAFAIPSLHSNQFFERTLALDETGYVAHFIENSSYLTTHASDIVQYVSLELRRIQFHDLGETERSILASVGMINVSILLWMALILIFVPLDLKRHYLKFKNSILSKPNAKDNHPMFNPPSPDAPLTSIWEELKFAVFIGGMSLFHWFAVLAALDILYFLWSGSETLWGILDISLNYQKTTCLLIGGKGGLAIFVVAHLLLSLPGVLLLSILTYRIASVCMNEGRILFTQNSPIKSGLIYDVQPFIARICQEHRIPVPKILIVNSGPNVLYSQSLLFGLAPIIIIHTTILEFCSLNELKALIAHELYHIKNDVGKIARYQFFSTFLLFPFNFLMMAHDYSRQEQKADEFALKIISPMDSLIQAIFNLIELNETRYEKPQSPKFESSLIQVKSWCLKRFQFLSYIHSDAMIGAAYPLQKERLTYLMKAHSDSMAVK